MKSVEQQLSEALASIVILTKDNKDLQESNVTLTATVSASQKASVTAEVNAAIKEAGLSEAAALWVRKQYEGKDASTDLKEAIEAVKPLATATKVVRGNGAAAPIDEAGDPAVSRAKLVKTIMENFKCSEKEAQLMAE